jgi:hypothetical protein
VNKLKPKQIAWLIPAAYFLHLLDEYFSGAGFSSWYSSMFQVDLSVNDFITINSVGFAVTLLIVILYSFNKTNIFLIAMLGFLFFINGLVHPFVSIVTATYSPGTLTGVLIYLPLGFLIFKKIFPLLPEQQRSLSVVTGLAIQLLVALIAFNM